jgi:hypothetical protein
MKRRRIEVIGPNDGRFVVKFIAADGGWLDLPEAKAVVLCELQKMAPYARQYPPSRRTAGSPDAGANRSRRGCVAFNPPSAQAKNDAGQMPDVRIGGLSNLGWLHARGRGIAFEIHDTG